MKYVFAEFPKFIVYSDGRIKGPRGGFLKTPINNAGYKGFSLKKNGKSSGKLVHRVLAEAFIPNPDNKRTVNHKNGNRKDNRLENLEWATYSENHLHAYKKLGRRSPNLGKFGKDSKTSKPIIQLKDGAIIKEWNCAADAEREGGFLNQHISKCCLGKRKSHKGFQWKFK